MQCGWKVAAAKQAGEPAPVLSAIKGVSMLFAINRSQALQEEGTISGEGNAAEELYQTLLDHPEGVLLCRADPERLVELGRFPALDEKTWNNLCLYDRRYLLVRNAAYVLGGIGDQRAVLTFGAAHRIVAINADHQDVAEVGGSP